jgi:uncharacterized protein (DUF1015 family)
VPQISPFTGLLFNRDVVESFEQVTSPPYDTIAPDQERRLHAISRYNVVRLILGREHAGDNETRNKYTRAASRLRRWQKEDVLVTSGEPAWYPYEMLFTFQGSPRRVRGLICQVALEEWGGSIVPHEKVLPAPVKDRLSLLRQVQANLSPVYALFRGPCRPLTRLFDEVARKRPFLGVTDESGVRHRMWVLRGRTEIARWLRDEQLLIADGHHRYTVALTYRDEMRARHGPGPWDHMMMLLVDAGAEDPPVLPIHRVLVSGHAPTIGTRVRDLAEVLSLVRDEDLTYGMASMERGRVVHRVGKLKGQPPTVCALHDQVLGDASLRFQPDAVLAEDAVRAGRATAAFFLPPTRVERIRRVIEHAERLPQKSTYFWPKPRTGCVIRPLLPENAGPPDKVGAGRRRPRGGTARGPGRARTAR